MKRINLVKEFADLKEALELSNQAFGLVDYDRSEFNRKVAVHKMANVRSYFLTDSGDVVFISEGGPGELCTIFHKFSWVSILDNGLAALVAMSGNRKYVIVGNYNRPRNSVRRSAGLWTVDQF